MEKWQFYFMIGSGIYLLLLGITMVIKKGLSRAVGVYNVLVGVLSIVGAVVAKSKGDPTGKIFSVFTVVLVVSFLMFAILKGAMKKR
ncbi:hypothetical protein Z968_11485 [Clostridium novyi A str. 4552]|uniref:Uncharacterized protein n=1 Tax=Clostridium novyi A str. 4552 TaxID=1444289 RepID=A0A0A0I1M2_CLONO|nr:hypothetical protein [Clostridium novyi]KGM94568.1 hypothetical protein Z968_11485 [Clostridium novyi A str. 4552]